VDITWRTTQPSAVPMGLICRTGSSRPVAMRPARRTLGPGRLPRYAGRTTMTVIHSAARRFGPGLWPGPRRQAHWAGRGLQGQRRAAGASRASGMQSTVEAGGASPDNARQVRPGRCDIFTVPGAPGATVTAWPWCWRARQRDTAGTAGGRSPGCRARQSPRRRACVRRTRRKLPPRNGESPWVNPGRLRWVTLAASLLPSIARARPSLFTAGAVRPGAPKVRP